jgi:hypothetical protein
MPSPDASQYIDLTLFDLSTQQIFLDALRYARIALPEFQPVEGAIETVLLEAMAIEVQDLVTAINRLPDGMLQALLGLIGLPRRDAIPATGLVKITSSRTTESDVPVGIRFYARLSGASEPQVLVSTSTATLSRSQSISTLARTSNVVTVTTKTHHGLVTGQVVEIAVDENLANGSGFVDASTTVTVVDETTFTYVNSGANVSVDASSSATYVIVDASIDPYAFVPVSAAIPGYLYLASGTSLNLLSSVPQISTSVLATDVDGGYDAETDAEFFQRTSSALNRMTSALVTARQITEYIASEPAFGYAYRVHTVDNCDDNRLTPSPGYALTLVARIDATPSLQIDSDRLQEIQDNVSLYTPPTVTVAVQNAALCKVSVDATVKGVSGYSSAQVESAVTSAITSYLNPNTWDWSTTIRVNEVEYAIRNATYEGVPVVAYVESVEITPVDSNYDDITPATVNAFSGTWASGTLTVTVPAPVELPEFDETFTSYVAIKETSGVYAIYEVVSVDTGEFTVSGTHTNGSVSGFWAPFGQVYNDGVGGKKDFVTNDPAPLVLCDAASVSVTVN